jgi:hypothetical protein
VITYDAKGNPQFLRWGQNQIYCVPPQAGAENFSASCFGPVIKAQRDFEAKEKAAGKDAKTIAADVEAARKARKLPTPNLGTAIYIRSGKTEADAHNLWVVLMPNAKAEDLGLPTVKIADGLWTRRSRRAPRLFFGACPDRNPDRALRPLTAAQPNKIADKSRAYATIIAMRLLALRGMDRTRQLPATGVRRACAQFALAVMLLRALLPVGWMPGTTPQGGVALVICNGDGPAQSMAGMSGMDHKSTPGGPHHNDACPFAAAPHYAPVLGLAALALPVLAFSNTQDRISLSLLAADMQHSPQSPRAPPTLA